MTTEHITIVPELPKTAHDGDLRSGRHYNWNAISDEVKAVSPQWALIASDVSEATTREVLRGNRFDIDGFGFAVEVAENKRKRNIYATYAPVNVADMVAGLVAFDIASEQE